MSRRTMAPDQLGMLGNTLREWAGLSPLQSEALNLSADNGCGCGEPGCMGGFASFARRWHVVNGVFQPVEESKQPRIALANGPLPPLGGRA